MFFSLALEARWGGRTVEVVVVLYLVPEEGTRDVDLLTSDNGDLLASEDLVMRKKCQRPSVESLLLEQSWQHILKNFLSTLRLSPRPLPYGARLRLIFLRKYSQKH